jgi:hypothetical protein
MGVFNTTTVEGKQGRRSWWHAKKSLGYRNTCNVAINYIHQKQTRMGVFYTTTAEGKEGRRSWRHAKKSLGYRSTCNVDINLLFAVGTVKQNKTKQNHLYR